MLQIITPDTSFCNSKYLTKHEKEKQRKLFFFNSNLKREDINIKVKGSIQIQS